MPKTVKRKKTTVTTDKNRQYRRQRIKEQLLANYVNKTQGITAIIGQRDNEGVEEYKVRWGGKYCRVTFDSWVPKEKLECPELIKNYHETLEEMLNQKDYDVEKVIDERVVDGKKEYLVKWEEWGPAFNTWEPEEHLEGCDEVLKFYTDWRDKSGEWLQILHNMARKNMIARVCTRSDGRIFYQPLEGGKNVEITCEKDMDLMYARVKELEDKGKIIKIKNPPLERSIGNKTVFKVKKFGTNDSSKSESDNKNIQTGNIHKEVKSQTSPAKMMKSTKGSTLVKNKPNVPNRAAANTIKAPCEEDNPFLIKISLLNCALADIGCSKCKKKCLQFRKFFEKNEKLQTYNIEMFCNDCGESKLLCLASCKSSS